MFLKKKKFFFEIKVFHTFFFLVKKIVFIDKGRKKIESKLNEYIVIEEED